MTNYTAEQLAGMSDDELRRAIAEALGWKRETRIEKGKLFAFDFVIETGEYPIFRWIDPSGVALFWSELDYIPDEIKSWPTDANAAWELPVGDWYLYVCKSDGKRARVHIVNLEADSVDRAMESEIKVDADSPARAICEAWVLWRQAQP